MIFVTGGTGLLGSHLLVELSKRGKNIRAIKRKTSDFKIVQAIFKYYLKDDSNRQFNLIEWIEADIKNVTTLKKAMQGCTEVYHCAGYVSFYRKDFKKLMSINKMGTANMVNVALSLGINKFSHVSSTAAIGRNELSTNYTENNKWATSTKNSNYAVSKYSAEMEVWRGKEEGLNVSIVNPSVILGAGDWTEGSLTLFSNIESGLKFYTEGVNAFVDARDVAFCMVELMEQNKFGERYLTISENLSFKNLFFKIADSLSVKRPTISVKPWMAEVAWRIESIKSGITGKHPKITKETSRSALSKSYYSHTKIVEAINHKFISIDNAILNSVNFHNFFSTKR